RLKGIGLVALDEVETASAELETIKSLGLAGVGIGVYVDDERQYNHPRYEPFCAAAEALELSVSLHILTGKRKAFEQFMVDYTAMPSWIQRSIAAMIFGGVFERHPKLIAVSVESDIGWIANFLERMDHAFGRFRFVMGTGGVLSDKLPSDYFFRNVRATFMRDHAGIASRHLIGTGNILWSSDYPHA